MSAGTETLMLIFIGRNDHEALNRPVSAKFSVMSETKSIIFSTVLFGYN